METVWEAVMRDAALLRGVHEGWTPGDRRALVMGLLPAVDSAFGPARGISGELLAMAAKECVTLFGAQAHGLGLRPDSVAARRACLWDAMHCVPLRLEEVSALLALYAINEGRPPALQSSESSHSVVCGAWLGALEGLYAVSGGTCQRRVLLGSGGWCQALTQRLWRLEAA